MASVHPSVASSAHAKPVRTEADRLGVGHDDTLSVTHDDTPSVAVVLGAFRALAALKDTIKDLEYFSEREGGPSRYASIRKANIAIATALGCRDPKPVSD
jgi:hypothetical protein